MIFGAYFMSDPSIYAYKDMLVNEVSEFFPFFLNEEDTHCTLLHV